MSNKISVCTPLQKDKSEIGTETLEQRLRIGFEFLGVGAGLIKFQ